MSEGVSPPWIIPLLNKIMSRIHNKSKFSAAADKQLNDPGSPTRTAKPPSQLARRTIFMQMSEEEEQFYVSDESWSLESIAHPG